MTRTPKIILHIGSPKTGSSAIQNYLMQYQKRLCLLGYFYPAHWRDANGVSPGHAALAAKLKANDLDGAAQWVETQYGKAQAHNKTLILSSEAFFSESKNLYPILKNFSDDIQVVGYCRFPADLVVSAYCHGIKRNFETRDLATYCEDVLKGAQHDFYTGQYFWDWREVAGHENVRFKLFNRAMFSKNSLHADFLKTIGCSERVMRQFIKKPAEINARFTPSVEQFKLIVNHFLDRQALEQNRQLDDCLQHFSDHSGESPKSTKQRLGADLYEQLMHFFKARFVELNENVLLGSSADGWQSLVDLNDLAPESERGVLYAPDEICTKAILPNANVLTYLMRCKDKHPDLVQQPTFAKVLSPLLQSTG